MPRETYEAWIDDEGVSFGTSASFSRKESQELLGKNPQFLYSVVADTPEEASAVHHIKMGWEPYVPIGPSMLCPNQCQSYFYPEGSGICLKCGDIC